MPPPAYYVTSADVLVEQPASHEIDFRALGVSKAEQDELIKLQKRAETALNTVQDSIVLNLLEQHYRLQVLCAQFGNSARNSAQFSDALSSLLFAARVGRRAAALARPA